MSGAWILKSTESPNDEKVEPQFGYPGLACSGRDGRSGQVLLVQFDAISSGKVKAHCWHEWQGP